MTVEQIVWDGVSLISIVCAFYMGWAYRQWQLEKSSSVPDAEERMKLESEIVWLNGFNAGLHSKAIHAPQESADALAGRNPG